MPANIAFIVSRSAELKAYAPVAMEALTQGCKVYFLCGPNPEHSWPTAPQYRPIKRNLKFPGSNQVEYIPFINAHEASSKLRKINIEHVFILNYRQDSLPYQLDQIAPRFYKLHGLQSYADYLATPPEFLKRLDSFFVFCPTMIRFYQSLYPTTNLSDLQKIFISVGNPMLDFPPQNVTSIRAKYGLPNNKKIVLLLSANLGGELWSKYIFGSPHWLYSILALVYKGAPHRIPEIWSQPKLKGIVNKIRHWSHNNNAVLVVKTRAKQNEPSFVSSLADYFITDSGTWLPNPVLELMAASDLVFGFNSTGILEAAALGKYTISIDLSRDHKITSVGNIFSDEIYMTSNAGQRIDYYKLASFLSRHTLSDFSRHSVDLRPYTEKFLGRLDQKAASRIINHILMVHASALQQP